MHWKYSFEAKWPAAALSARKWWKGCFCPRFQSDRTNLGHLKCFLFFWVHHNRHRLVSRIFLQVLGQVFVPKNYPNTNHLTNQTTYSWPKYCSNASKIISHLQPFLSQSFKWVSVVKSDIFFLPRCTAQYSLNPSRIFSHLSSTLCHQNQTIDSWPKYCVISSNVSRIFSLENPFYASSSQ